MHTRPTSTHGTLRSTMRSSCGLWSLPKQRTIASCGSLPEIAQCLQLRKSSPHARLEVLRRQFLHLHDKKTAGIMGLFPAALNLPVRLTQTEDAQVGAVKNARGTLVGWTLPDMEAARLQADSIRRMHSIHAWHVRSYFMQ